MSNAVLAVLLGLATSASWAASNVFVQKSARALGSLRAMLWGQLLGCLVLVPASLLLEPVPTSWPSPLVLVLAGGGSVLGYVGMMRAFAGGPMSAVSPVVASWPLPALVAGLLLGEHPSARQVVGALLVVAGAAGNGGLATGGTWHGSRAATFAWAAASCVGFGTMVVGVGMSDLGPIGVVPATWFTSWVFLLPAFLRHREAFRPPPSWGAVGPMAVFEAAGFVMFAFAARLAGLAVASPPAALSSLFTLLWAVVFLGERPRALQYACVAAVALGCVLLGR